MAQFNIQAYKAVGGVFFKQALRTSPLIFLAALFSVSCEKEHPSMATPSGKRQSLLASPSTTSGLARSI